MDNVFRQKIPDVIQWILRFSYGVLEGGTDAEILADNGLSLNLGQQRVMEVPLGVHGR